MADADDTIAAPGDPSAGAPVPDEHNATTTREEIPATPEEVFAVLADPATYPDWLVGARRIRAIDEDWPAVGSSFQHTIGWGPARLQGSTSVRRCTPPTELVLGAGMGPLGEATVRFELTASSGGTVVELHELPARGPARWAGRVLGPVVRLGLWGRNAASLGALSNVVARRNSA
jgi:uncharacterized protein YndB with AHSA1/START domain